MILTALGIVDYTPLQLSGILRSLNLSHSYVCKQGVRYSEFEFDGYSKEQPAWPVIVDRVHIIPKVSVPRERLIYLVIDARSALATTNIDNSLWPEQRNEYFIPSLIAKLKEVRKANTSWEFVSKDPSILDYVNVATKPSFLNDLQTEFYRISNYAQRKEIQIACIAYFGGFLSFSKLKTQLKSNLKFQELLRLMESPKARELQEAVAQLRFKSVDQVAKDTGFETFELSYILKSSQSQAQGVTKKGK
jgi:hypothetical protein